jgi:PTS system fructose-specific IIC component
MPVVVIPLLSVAVTGVITAVAVARPIAAATASMTNWLDGLSGTNAAVLGLLLGAMMAFDMGGPVNKVAYTFALASPASGDTKIMAAVMAAADDAAARLHARDRRPQAAVHPPPSAPRGRPPVRPVVHHRGRDPVRGGRPAAGHPVPDGGQRRDWRAVDGVRREVTRPARRHLVIGLNGKPELYAAAIVAGIVISAT